MNAKSFALVMIAAGLMLGAGGASAQDEQYNFTKAGDNSKVKVPAVDKDGDGCIEKSEVTPGGQLEKRFDTRDANHDGKLCKDEYYTP